MLKVVFGLVVCLGALGIGADSQAQGQGQGSNILEVEVVNPVQIGGVVDPVVINDDDPVDVDVQGTVSVSGSVSVDGMVTTIPAAPSFVRPRRVGLENTTEPGSTNGIFYTDDVLITQVSVVANEGGNPTNCTIDIGIDEGFAAPSPIAIIPYVSGSRNIIHWPFGNGIVVETGKSIEFSIGPFGIGFCSPEILLYAQKIPE